MWGKATQSVFQKMKKCEHCGKFYTPSFRQENTQKYCTSSCKDKAAWKRFKDSGDIRRRKGGYNRLTYIMTWMKAMDDSVPCHYCGERLYPDSKFVLDHKQPLSKLTTREEMQDIDNLVVACIPCNVEKGSTPYEDFTNK